MIKNFCIDLQYLMIFGFCIYINMLLNYFGLLGFIGFKMLKYYFIFIVFSGILM